LGNSFLGSASPSGRGPGLACRLSHGLHGGVDLGFRIIAAQAEPQRAINPLVGQAEGAEHMRALPSRLGAGGPGRERDAVAEGEDQGLGFHALERDVEVARQASLHRAVDVEAVEAPPEALQQTAPEGQHPLGLSFTERPPTSCYRRSAGGATQSVCGEAHSRVLASHPHESS
jgi:hypothetical protein